MKKRRLSRKIIPALSAATILRGPAAMLSSMAPLYGPPPVEPTTAPTAEPTGMTVLSTDTLYQDLYGPPLYGPPPASGISVGIISVLLILPVFIVGTVIFIKKSSLKRSIKALIVSIFALIAIAVVALISLLASK